MNNILIVINGLGGGGSQKNVAFLANNFIEKGAKVYILTLIDYCDSFFYLDSRIEIIRPQSNQNGKKRNVFLWRRIIRKISREKRITTIIAIGYRFGLLCSSVRKKERIIIRGTTTKKMSFLDSFLFCFLKKRIHTIVAQTNAQKSCYPKCIRKKVKVISNPFETFANNRNIDGFFSKRIICIGRYHLQVKRQDLIINDLKDFFREHNDYCLELYGEPQIDDDGSTIKKIEQIINDNGLRNNVHIHDIDKNVWDKVLPSFSFLCASTREGMPNSLIEASLRGIIPISTMWVGCDEIIQDGITGFFENGVNHDSYYFGKILSRLINDRKLYESISDNCSKNNNKKYDKDVIFSKWLHIVDEGV